MDSVAYVSLPGSPTCLSYDEYNSRGSIRSARGSIRSARLQASLWSSGSSCSCSTHCSRPLITILLDQQSPRLPTTFRLQPQFQHEECPTHPSEAISISSMRLHHLPITIAVLHGHFGWPRSSVCPMRPSLPSSLTSTLPNV